MSSTQFFANLNAPFAHCWYKMRPGARILMYHRVSDTAVTRSSGPDQLTVSPELFAEQIAWLAQYRKILPLTTLLDQINAGNVDGEAVALTFDDGYLDNLTHALPVLEKHNAPATIYITSSFASQELRHPRYDNESGRLHLNWQEIRDLSSHELIDIGSHTVTHPMLSELSEQKVLHEIKNSKSDIEQHIDGSVTSFCYPSGNYTARELKIVQECGYQNALSVKPGVSRKNSDVFALKRTEVTYKDSPDNLALKLSGALDIFHHVLDYRREIQFAKQRKLSNK